MPATYMTYPNGGTVLPVQRGRPGVAQDALLLDAAYLQRFGEMRVPAHLWRANRQRAAHYGPDFLCGRPY
jgi:hypothetical protein